MKTKTVKPKSGAALKSYGNGTRSCGECLMDRAQVVHLDANGRCPKCGANYGAEK